MMHTILEYGTMRTLLSATTLLLWSLWSAPLGADITLTGRASGKVLGMGGEGESVQFIRGTKMRSDATVKGEKISTIFDVDARRMIVVNHKRKEAEIVDLATLDAELKKITDADVAVSMKPTGQTRQILGETCDGYDVRIAVKFAPAPEMALTLVMAGPAWIAKNAPGKADYTAFFHAAAEKGFILSDPKAAKVQPGQAKGVAALYRAMAQAGVAYAIDYEMRFEGEGMMVGMMNKMAAGSFGSIVTAVSTDPIPDETFAVPAGYRTRQSR
jgi:hypothetical protein